MTSTLYSQIKNDKAQRIKQVAALIDPDDLESNRIPALCEAINEHGVSYILLGGSYVAMDQMEQTIQSIKAHTKTPVILFPGDMNQLNPHADAVLALSVISGRNPDHLIGQHVTAAPRIKAWNLEAIATGYMLIQTGRMTAAEYISQSFPIPGDQAGIAAATAMAGEMLGMHTVYLDGGSGADAPISPKLISAVARSVEIPIWVGGGLRTAQSIRDALRAGADIAVIGNGFVENPNMLANWNDGI